MTSKKIFTKKLKKILEKFEKNLEKSSKAREKFIECLPLKNFLPNFYQDLLPSKKKKIKKLRDDNYAPPGAVFNPEGRGARPPRAPLGPLRESEKVMSISKT